MTLPSHPRRAGRLIAASLAAAGMLAMTACSPTATSTPAATASGPVTLRLSTWGNENRMKLTQKALDAFTAKNPTIKVNLENTEWGSYWDKLATMTAANDAPDVIQMDESFIGQYGTKKVLLDLGTVSKDLDLSVMDKTVLDTGVVGGTQVGVPVGVTNLAVAVNPTLLEKAGIAMPNDKTWTWADFVAISTQVSEKLKADGIYGNGGVGLEPHLLSVWARQRGEEVFPTESQKPLSEETTKLFFEYLKELIAKGAAPSAPQQVENSSGPLNSLPLATNKAAFAVIWNTQATAFGSASGTKLGLLRLPAFEAGKPHMVNKASMYWSVFSRTKHPTEAAKLINFLLSDPEATGVLTTERGIPAIGSVRTSVADKVDAQARVALEFAQAVAPDLVSPPQVTPATASSWQKEFVPIATDVIFERATTQEGATRVKQLLDSFKK